MPIAHLLLLLAVQGQAAQSAAPRPIDPGNWVRAEDYPTAAARTETGGTVGFSLSIDPQGRPTGCEIVQSAGSELDSATCRILVQRARFEPARDASGAAIASSYASKLSWSLPQDPVVPFAPAQRLVETWTPEQGGRESCRLTNQGELPWAIAIESCAPNAAAAEQPPRRPHSTLRSYTNLLPEGLTPSFPTRIEGAIVGRVRFRFEVDERGIVSACEPIGSRQRGGPLGHNDCEPLRANGKPIFDPAPPGAPPRRGVYENILTMDMPR